MPNDFVQFPHPGGEPPVNFIKNGICPANTTGSHFRKFLHAVNGSYVIPNISQDTKIWDRRNDVSFTLWGEWEHSSRVSFPSNFHQRPRAIIYNGFPFQLHTPITPPPLPPTSGTVAGPCGIGVNSCSTCHAGIQSSNVMSTDPFVFCEPMLYYHCKIHRYETLRNLQRGDIVVFGSKLNWDFVVDTVFIVADRVSVQDPSLCGLFVQANEAHLNDYPYVYSGATFANPVDGMFGFFPALPCAADGTPQPFPRPTLNFPGLINQNHGRGLRVKTIQNTKQVWLQIVSEITQQGKVLGLRA